MAIRLGAAARASLITLLPVRRRTPYSDSATFSVGAATPLCGALPPSITLDGVGD